MDALLAQHGPVVLDPAQVAGFTTTELADVVRLLDEYAARGVLTVQTRFKCPCCYEPLDPADAGDQTCPLCGEAYAECGEVATRLYVRYAPPTRSVPWVVVLHGMNTRGRWQEELKWLVDTTAGRAVPFDVDKYGKVRPGALFRWRLRRLSDRVATRLRERAATNDERLGARPDVIAHSLGTLLIGLALLRNADLAVGRVILTGCILRPDFDWSALVARGRVEAVLNHRGARDLWVPRAGYFIPGAGPAGRTGFHHGTVEHESPQFGHSDFFGAAMGETYDRIWRPFLTWPIDDLPSIGNARSTPWHPRRWLSRSL